MKTFHYNFGGKEVRITFNERIGTVDSVEEDGTPFVPCADRMPIYAGVISLALAQYETEEVHDDEPEIITLDAQKTPWSNPTRHFSNESFPNR